MLRDGQTLRASQQAGETRTYSLETQPGRAYLIEVGQEGLDFVVTLGRPDGTSQSFDSPLLRDESEFVLLENTARGTYKVSVHCDEYTGATGAYSISLAAQLSNTPEVAAWRLMSEGAAAKFAGGQKAAARAIARYEDAANRWEQLEDRRHAAYATLAVAMIDYRQVFDRKRSAEWAARAVEAYQALDQPALLASALHLQAQALIETAEEATTPQTVYEQALGLFDKAASLQRTLGRNYELAQTINNIGVTYFYMGNWRRAREYWQQAAPLFRNANEWSGELLPLGNIAVVDAEEGYNTNAADAFERILELLPPGKDLRHRLDTLANLGDVHRALGNFDQALQSFSAAKEIADQIDSPYGQGWALFGIGETYYSMGEMDLAAEYLQSSLPKEKQAGDQRGEAAVLRYLGNIEQTNGDYAAALKRHERALKLATAPPDRALVYLLVAQDLAALGRFEEAERAARAALDIAATMNSDSLLADAQQQLGRVYLGRGDSTGASQAFEKALTIYASLGLHSEQARALNGLALAARARGDLREAVRYGETSLGHIESVRGQVAHPELRAFYLGARRSYYELQMDMLMRLHEESGALSDQNLRAALAVSERARARMIVDLLRETAVEPRDLDATLRTREKDLYATLAELRVRRDALVAQETPHAGAAADLRAVLDRLADVENDLNILETQRRTMGPQSTSSSRTLTASEMQQAVDRDSVLIQYALGADRSYAWVMTEDTLTAVVLPDRKTVEEAAIRVFNGLRSYPSASGATPALDSDLRRLSELVLAPVANLLTKKRVLVAADGALQYVPFAVLQMPSADEGPSTRLLSSHEVLEIPSVSALVSLRSVGARRMPTKQVAVFADPVFERTDSRLEQTQLVSSAATPEPTLTRAAQRSGSMTRLPLTALEASAIGNLVPQDERLIVLGFDANRETVLRTDLSDYRIVHFATHGLIDARYPDLSALVLSRFDPSGASRNGLLELHDIYELKLNADLVVLSACETALGRAVHGEGLIGLTQGFLYAGARSVLAALWPVPDRATAEFMGRFYQYMLTERLSPPEALRRAQLSLAAESRWRSPYFWGAFVLVGDWKAS